MSDFRAFPVMPNMTLEQIGRICQWLSTPEVEVHARIEMVNGKLYAYLAQSDRSEQVPEFLKRSA